MAEPPFTPTPAAQGPALLQRLFQQATQQPQPLSMHAPPATPEPAAAHSAQAMSDLIKSQLGLATPQPSHPVFALASHPTPHYTPAPVEAREHPTMSPVSSPMKTSLETSSKSRPEVEPGVALASADQARVEYVTGSAGRRVQLNVTPITIYKTEEQYSLGQLIAVNPSFICYSVKGEMVRILATTNSSLRSLLRGHSKPVHDLAFAPALEADGASLLASTAKDGHCFVWRIAIKEKDITTDTIAKLTLEEGLFYTRVVWNPLRPGQLVAIRADSEVHIWSVSAAAPGSATLLRKLSPASPVLAIAFSDASIALGTRDGNVSLYSQDTGDLQQRWQPHGGKAVTFVSLRQGTIVTGTRKNREFRLWDLQTSLLAHEFALLAPQPKTFANLAAFDSSGRFLFIANTKSPILYVLHVSASRFDYVAEFTVTYPILSFVMTTLQRAKPADAADDDPLPPPETLLWCLQTAAIQRYHITEAQSAPKRVLAAESFALPPLGHDSMAAAAAPAAAAAAAAPPPTEAPAEVAPVPAVSAPVAPTAPAAPATAATTAPPSGVVPPSGAEANGRSTPANEEEERDWQRKIEEARQEQVAKRHAEDGDKLSVMHGTHAASVGIAPLPAADSAVAAVPAATHAPAPAAAPVGASSAAAEEEAALRIQSAFRSHLSRRASQDAAPPAADAAVSTPEAVATPAAPSASAEPKTPTRAASSKKAPSDKKKKSASAAASPVVAAPYTPTAGAPVTILARPKVADAPATPAAAPAVPQPEPAAASSSVPPKKGSGSASDAKSAAKAEATAVQLDKHAARALAEQLAPLIARSVQSAVASEMQAQLPAALRAYVPAVAAAAPVAAAQPSLSKEEMREAMQAAFTACFRETVIPAFERATQVMFAQMQAAFEHGLSENLRRMPVPQPPAPAPAPVAVIPPEVTRLHAENAQLQTALTQQLRSATDTLIHLGESLQQRLNEAPAAVIAPAPAPAPATSSKKSSKHAAEPKDASAASAAAPAAAVPSTPERRKAEKVSHTPAPAAAAPAATLPPPVAAHAPAPHAHAHPPQPANNSAHMPADSAILAAGRPRAPSVPVPVPTSAPMPLPMSMPQALPQHPPPPHAKPFPLMRNFDELFNYVLNANDLQMVTDVCARHDPNEVFASTNLSPMVLLPLVQQLGSDLSRALPPKLNWLRACLVRLDPRDPLLAEVLPDVLQQLRASIDAQRAVERDPAAQGALGSLLQLVMSILQRL